MVLLVVICPMDLTKYGHIQKRANNKPLTVSLAGIGSHTALENQGALICPNLP